jgi:phosphoglycolate phosphatase-like HAD superfamily hydrolase
VQCPFQINQVPHAGCTDRGIVRDVCRMCHVPDGDIQGGMDECIRLSSEFIKETADEDMSDDVLPGIPELLTELNKHRVYCGLVTGNFQDIGWTKLQRAGIRNHFELGAFGSDRLDRNDILSLAVDRAVEIGFRKEFDDVGQLTNVYHVGDAIADMQAARHVGGRGIGVLTGAFAKHDLAPHAPFKILDDLTDIPSFLRIVGLK